MKIHWETVSPDMRQVMVQFAHSPLGASFYLAGGTALALQLGHRRSFDLDFFTQEEDFSTMRQPLETALHDFSPVLADTSWGNLVFLAAGVRVAYFSYGYPIVAPFIDAEGLRLAGLADIALMKMDAILGRASRKDFHDLYAICQQMPLRLIFDLASQKYPAIRDFEAQVVKRLVFFDRADQEAAPVLLNEVSWETVKSYFRAQAIAIGKNWLAGS